MEKIWSYLMDNLFCKKTMLFYDFINTENRGKFENYLPTPEQIKRSVPNPCGWGTGMEDSMIHGGTMLEAALTAYDIYKDKRLLDLAKKFFSGMKNCASVSESEGFLARSISPCDGKTHYIDSSRDQYTHWIVAAAFYYKSGYASNEEKSFIKNFFVAIANRCRKYVNEQHSYNLCREDGGLGIVTGMWNVMAHEYMRLPMFYLAGLKIGGEESFGEDYIKYRDKAMEKSEQLDFSLYGHPFALNQMQMSLRFVYEYDEDEAFKARCEKLMLKIAQYGLSKVSGYAQTVRDSGELLYEESMSWDKLPATYNGYLSGYDYYVPLGFKSVDPRSLHSAWLLRDVGDAASLYTGLPHPTYNDELMIALQKTLAAINLEKHTSDAPVYLLLPYYTLERLKNQ